MKSKKLKLIKTLLDITRLRCKYWITALYLALTFGGRQHLVLSFIIWMTVISKCRKFNRRFWFRWDRTNPDEGRFKEFLNNNTYDPYIKALQKYLMKCIDKQNKINLNIYNFIYNNLYNTYTQVNSMYKKIINYDFISFLFINNIFCLTFLFLLTLLIILFIINRVSKNK